MQKLISFLMLLCLQAQATEKTLSATVKDCCNVWSVCVTRDEADRALAYEASFHQDGRDHYYCKQISETRYTDDYDVQPTQPGDEVRVCENITATAEFVCKQGW